MSAQSEVNDQGTNCCLDVGLNSLSHKNKAKVEIAQLWLYSYLQILSNNFSRLLPIFFVPPTSAEKAIYSEGCKPVTIETVLFADVRGNISIFRIRIIQLKKAVESTFYRLKSGFIELFYKVAMSIAFLRQIMV